MKLILLVALFFVAAQAEESAKNTLVPILKQCVDEKDVDRFVKLVKSTNLPVEDAEISKVLTCYWRQLGIIKGDDSIDLQKAAEVTKKLIKALNPKNSHVDADVDNSIQKCKKDLGDLQDSLEIKVVKARNCVFQNALGTA